MVAVKIRKTSRGLHFVELPEDVIMVANLKAGDEVEIFLGSSINETKRDDIVIRKK